MDRAERKRRRGDQKDKRRVILHHAWDEADAVSQPVSFEKLREMASSTDAYQRLLALMLARRQIREGAEPADYLEFAHGLIRDPDNNCRWQAVIVVGESIDTDSEAVWKVVAEFGDSADDDMRSAIACVLLEHLLDVDFKLYFRRVRDEVLNGRRRFLKTLDMCWFDDCSGPNYEGAQRYLRRHGLLGSPRRP